MCELCNDILHRFSCCSNWLQSSTIELSPAMGLLKSLDTYIDECGEKFDYYHQQASDRCGNSIYKSTCAQETIHDGDAPV